MTAPFAIARLPRIEFGPGTSRRLPELAARFGNRLLLVTGGRSLEASSLWPQLGAGLQQAGVHWEHLRVDDEPSPAMVDDAVTRFRDNGIQVVAAIGGGSVLDAGKAIAGLLATGDSVLEYLEGVGPERAYQGPALPFIAVPTTAGTGSEATKNAVLSRRGADGYKKSFRDERLVPEYAVVDPDLLASCPPDLIAANGMDALTQLLESYVSRRANRWTDALARDGLRAVRDGLLPWFRAGGPHPDGQSRMAYGALLSGITLAQVGLGSVHGLAAPLGAFFPIPHGVACGTLVAAATRTNIAAMVSRDADNPALDKYARAAALLCGREFSSRAVAWEALAECLEEWTRELGLPRLGHYGMTANNLPAVVANCRGNSMKTNPVDLDDMEVTELLRGRL